ncbi:MAG: hypothetical protein LBI70_02415, partial [Rickettsiales bacterium]|nr:hypothetical protein [Rickettsiales bacterium]
MIDICNLCKNLCTDNFFDSLSFSEMLIFLKNSVAEKVDVGNFLQKLGYSCGDLENFLYRMIFFENEDFEFAMQRALC